MQRARHVFQQKTNGHQVEEDPESAADPVMRFPALPDHIRDGDFADAGAIPGGEGRDEAMHLAVQGNVVDDLAAIGLEGRPEVVNVDARELRHQPVRAPRGNAPHHEVVDALPAPSADNVVPFFQLFQKQRDLARVVLQIAVHGEDELAFGVIEPGCQRRGLAEVAPQLHYEDAAVDGGNLFQQPAGAVVGAVIHKHQLEGIADMLHHLFQTVVERGDVLLFVMERNDDGILGHQP